MRRLIVSLAAISFASALLTGCGGAPATPIRTFTMGEKVQAGALIYTVFETQWLTHLGEKTSARLPQTAGNRFFLVRLSIVNSGNAETIAPTFVLLDDHGKTIPESSEADGVPQYMGFLHSVKPADTLQGHIIFDVPPAHYKLRVTDENGEHVALVDIPLTYSNETPDLPPTDQLVPEKK